MNDEQKQQLEQPLNPAMIAQRQGASGKMLSYVEGHDAIDTANKIFGFGNWGYDLIYCKLEVILDPITDEAVGIAYKAAVRLHVAGCEPVTDVGSQPVAAWNVADVVAARRKPQDAGLPMKDWEKTAARRTIMESHEQAEKGAVTDALKRALRTFGNQFGNSLYGNGNGAK